LPETDLTEDLRKIDVPALFLHGDADQIVPITDSASLAAKVAKGAPRKSKKARPTACARPRRTGSTPTCRLSSAADRAPQYLVPHFL
jgi:fermentation-respiration switch protein FrsA (DUF1100 family)